MKGGMGGLLKQAQQMQRVTRADRECVVERPRKLGIEAGVEADGVIVKLEEVEQRRVRPQIA